MKTKLTFLAVALCASAFAAEPEKPESVLRWTQRDQPNGVNHPVYTYEVRSPTKQEAMGIIGLNMLTSSDTRMAIALLDFLKVQMEMNRSTIATGPDVPLKAQALKSFEGMPEIISTERARLVRLAEALEKIEKEAAK